MPMDKSEVDVKRKAMDRERKRMAKDQMMRGYARQSISIIDKLKGVQKGLKRG